MYSTHCAAGHIDVDNGLSYLKAERKYALSCGTGDRRINDGWFLATAATNDAVNLSFDIVRAHVMNEYEYVCMFPWHRVGIEDRCQHKLEGAECTQLREDPKEFILVDLPPLSSVHRPRVCYLCFLKKRKMAFQSSSIIPIRTYSLISVSESPAFPTNHCTASGKHRPNTLNRIPWQSTTGSSSGICFRSTGGPNPLQRGCARACVRVRAYVHVKGACHRYCQHTLISRITAAFFCSFFCCFCYF